MSLNEQNYDSYPITEKKQRMIAVYLDLLEEFDRLCKQAGIKYWVYFGTLLGTIRHKGFIPWDDDVDIMMPRESFDKLWRMTNQQFGTHAPYFLQNPVTDPTYAQMLVRFRRSDTTAVTNSDLTYLRERPRLAPYHMGMCLAIFPLDNCCRPPFLCSLRKKVAYLFMGVDYRANRPAAEKPLLHKICRFCQGLIGRQHLISLLQFLYRTRNQDSTMVQCLDGFYPIRHYWHAEDFRDTLMLPYESLTVPVPVGYDRLLTDCYGDYMTPPPPEARTEKHDDTYMDPDTPYTQAVPQLLRGEISIH